MVAQANGTHANHGGGSSGDCGGEPYFDCLIVGTGPAGGALASFLTQNGESVCHEMD
jgi:cation diffusion facilitator CzcD-associated flavoprotein CzcO